MEGDARRATGGGKRQAGSPTVQSDKRVERLFQKKTGATVRQKVVRRKIRGRVINLEKSFSTKFEPFHVQLTETCVVSDRRMGFENRL